MAKFIKVSATPSHKSLLLLTQSSSDLPYILYLVLFRL